MMKAATYDPMYCLSEHLDYFNESVAGKHELLKVDFDEIFGNGYTTTKQSQPVSTKPPISSSKISPPPSPKSVVLSMPAVEISPKPIRLDREKAVVSPTTVTSTAIFSDKGGEDYTTVRPASDETKSRKRKMSDSPAPILNTPASDDKEDVRRERNRQHAKRSRQRKRQFMNSLEQSVQDLKAENEKLFQLLGLTTLQDRSVVTEREVAMNQTANERFIEALQRPQNRVLSDDTLSSLREHFHS